MSLPRRLVAEGLGTAFLLAVVIGSGIMGERLSEAMAPLPCWPLSGDGRRPGRADFNFRPGVWRAFQPGGDPGGGHAGRAALA